MLDQRTSQKNIQDLAKWFLSKEAMTQKKLQKLCYYAVAWGYALLDRPIVENSEFEAWVHGPVNTTLRSKYIAAKWNSIPKEQAHQPFSDDIEELLESVWVTYGDKDGNQLEVLSHQERPWVEARGLLGEFEPSSKKIKTSTMKELYSSIYNK